jgi:hypothetical protein
MGNQLLTLERPSESLVGTNGDLELAGSKRKQLVTAVEYLTELQSELSDEVVEAEKLMEDLKTVSHKIKSSPLIMQQKQLRKELKQKKSNISEIASRRSGALGLCKKQGLDIKKHLKNAVMIGEGL